MPERSARGPTRVVIVGGGCAGMAAAWELAKQPGYDIHVYEKEPRLGGKGSSTRDDEGRILEHGLHVWMGWYENAFRMMRQCYAVVEQKGLGASWQLAHDRFEDAFMPEPNVGLVDPNFQGKPVSWNVLFPPNEGMPGTPMQPGDNPFTMASYMSRLFQMAKALVLSEVGDMPGVTPGAPRPDGRSRSDEILNLDIKTPPSDSTAALLNRMAEISKAGALTGAAALLQLVTILEVWLRQQNIGPKTPESTLAIAEAAVSQARKLLRDITAMDARLRVKTEVIDIVLTIMIGLYTDRVMFRADGLDSLNDFDYREWLRLHGATKTSLESRFIRAAYDFAFAYENGDLKKPRLAAGVALRGGLRMFFTYRGAAFWRMCSGMGDAIFAPLYAVLEDWRTTHAAQSTDRSANPSPKAKAHPHLPKLRSPVEFHFGHVLSSVEFDEAGGSLTGMTFDGQWTIKPVLPAGAWPEKKRPKKAVVRPGVRRLTRRASHRAAAGRDQFDFAIIATGVLDFERVFVTPFGKDKASRPKPFDAWATTTKLTKTIATKSAQVWLDKDLYALGWRRGSGLFTCMGRDTFDTYADMTHLIPAEERYAARLAGGQGGPAEPRWSSISYFCNPLHETFAGPGIGEAQVEADLELLITDQMGSFWPGLFDEKSDRAERVLEWERRVKSGQASTYARANVEGSDRYTLSLPGSISSRVSPLDPGIDNMTVAGDWTACGLDCGCVEAAVMSGMLAAAAISGCPELTDIVGYDQP